MSTVARLGADYLAALGRHVRGSNEMTLREGYELGRRALAEGVSVLELAMIHHEALGAALQATEEDRTAEVVTAAADFFRELLSAFEMVHRGFREVASAVAAERRHAAMLRRLSSFLGDASLSARHGDVAAEVLYLVTEHARELTGAGHGIAGWGEGDHEVRVSSGDEDSLPLRDPSLRHRLEDAAGPFPARISRAEWSGHPRLRSLGVVSNLLAVALTALDGRPNGVLQLMDKRGADFSADDEAVLVQLADMASSALERAELYRSRYAPR